MQAKSPHGFELGRLLFHRKAIGLSPYPLALGNPIGELFRIENK